MDDISKELHAIQTERRNNIIRSFSNRAETADEDELLKKADDSEEIDDDEEMDDYDEEETEESNEADEDETEKSDIMYALGSGNIDITKSGKEIKEQVESVLLPELNAHLAVKEAEAKEKLCECGAAPTSDPHTWWTGDVKMDVGYKIYDWRDTEFCKPEFRMYDSLSASDEAEKKGNCPTSEAEAKARLQYNEIVRAICNIRVDIKACEILKGLKDNIQYKLTPRQIIALRF